MAVCYADDATFKDIAFDLKGRREIHAMWRMVCSNRDLRVHSVEIVRAIDGEGTANWKADYTFGDDHRPVHNELRSEFTIRDGRIIAQHDHSDALKWGMQALGPVKGLIAWLRPSMRQKVARDKLEKFKKENP
jgi:hypothetical protein